MRLALALALGGVSRIAVAAALESLDFSAADNSQYIALLEDI